MGQSIVTQLPFSLGQSLREVLGVVRKTGRTLRQVEFVEESGRTTTIDVDRRTDIREKLGILGIDTRQTFRVMRRIYSDCELEFQFVGGQYIVTRAERRNKA